MKNCRNGAAALVLALVLSTSAFAGEIHTGIAAPPPPPAANGEMHTGVTDGGIHTGATDGVMQTGAAASTPQATDSVTEIALGLLQSLMNLF